MSILTLDKRTLVRVLALRVVDTILICSIHRAVDIGVVDTLVLVVANHISLLVVYRARLVVSLDPVVALVEVRAVTRLVSERPIDDRWVVEITQYHTLITDKVSILVVLTLCQGLVLVTHTVRLDVTLVADIDTVLVAEVVPEWRVRIVAGTNSVDVQLLHNLDITNHILTSYIVARIRVHLMAVGTLDKDRATVHQELCVLNLDLAETNLESGSLNGILAIDNLDDKAIEGRNLSAPRRHLVEVPATLNLALLNRNDLLLDLLAAWAIESQTQLLDTLCSCDVQIEVALGIVVVQVSHELHILQVLLVACVDVAVATDTREAEEVLVLQVCTIAPTINLHCEEVLFTRLHILRNLELGLQLRVLAVTYIVAVYPQRYIRGSRAYMYKNLLATPLRRNFDSVTIRTYGVALGWHIRRVALIEVLPCVARILVERHTIAVHLPQARYRHLTPCRVIILWRVELLRLRIGCICRPIELPYTTNRTIERRLSVVVLCHHILGSWRNDKCGAHRQTILLEKLWILPLWVFGSHCIHTHCKSENAQ